MKAGILQTEVPDQIEELADRLEVTYGDRVSSEVVDGVVSECYEPMKHARIKAFVAVLVEHNSRRRLRELSPIRHSSPASPETTANGWGSRLAVWVQSRLRISSSSTKE